VSPFDTEERKVHPGAIGTEDRLARPARGEELDPFGLYDRGSPTRREGAEADGEKAERAQGETPELPLLPLKLNQASCDVRHVRGRHGALHRDQETLNTDEEPADPREMSGRPERS
jgi:hypothetical protein